MRPVEPQLWLYGGKFKLEILYLLSLNWKLTLSTVGRALLSWSVSLSSSFPLTRRFTRQRCRDYHYFYNFKCCFVIIDVHVIFFVTATQADPWHYRHHCQCHVIDTLFTVIIANITLSAVQIISATVRNTDNTAVLSTALSLSIPLAVGPCRFIFFLTLAFMVNAQSLKLSLSISQQ